MSKKTLLLAAIFLLITINCTSNAATIHQAAAKGDLLLVKSLVLSDPSAANSTDERDVTALHMAAFYGRLSVVKYLLSAGAAVDSMTRSGYTPLLWAAWQKQLPVVRELVEHGAEVNAKSAAGMNSLHFAVQNQDIEMAKFLIGKGADKSAKDSLAQTPVDMARAANLKSFEKIFPELVEKTKIADKPPTPQPKKAEPAKSTKTVAAEKPKQATKTPAKPKPEPKQAAQAPKEPTKKQVKQPAKPPTKSVKITPKVVLTRAIILKILDAADMQDLQTIAFMLDDYPKLLVAEDAEGATMLHWLAQADWAEGIDYLVSLGANVNAAKKDGVTPLLVSAALDKTDALAKLLELGADAKLRDKQGRSALSLAKERGSELAEQILLATD